MRSVPFAAGVTSDVPFQYEDDPSVVPFFPPAKSYPQPFNNDMVLVSFSSSPMDP